MINTQLESRVAVPGTKEVVRHWGLLALKELMILVQDYDLVSGKLNHVLGQLGIYPDEQSVQLLKNAGGDGHIETVGLLVQELPKISNGILEKNLKWLQKKLDLSHHEVQLMTWVYLIHKDQAFQAFLLEFPDLSYQQLIRLVSKIVGTSENKIKQMLGYEAKLVRLGILKANLFENAPMHARLSLLDSLFENLSEEELNYGHFSVDFTRASFADLTINDFPHLLDDIDDLQVFIQQVCKSQTKGINILIYGPEASGKTQFIKALADRLDLALYEISFSVAKKTPMETLLSTISRAQHLLEGDKKNLLLVDDLQNQFENDSSDFMDSGSSASLKHLVNTSIGKNQLPTIWVTNRLDIFSYRDLSRFSYCLELKKPTRAMRQDFLRKKMGNSNISESWIVKTAMKENVPFETLEKIANFTKLVCSSKENQSAEVVFDKALAKANKFLKSADSAASIYSAEQYNQDFINADVDLVYVTDALKGHSEARICLSGPPGCGKTGYAHHLAYLLDKPVITKKGSDILGRYLGDTEQNLAGAFQEAKSRDALLLIDEVDGLLSNRQDAQRNWEVSIVNELLTQIDTFKGLLVVTTNLFEKLDPAAMRRFDLKVKFDYLNNKQIEQFWDMYIEQHSLKNDDQIRQDAMCMKELTPGDFANIERQSKFMPLKDAGDLIGRLKKEASFKREQGEGKAIGFLVS
jgi:SpoVK/Ycf46/Vps4 family AAA+-type ATPase